MVKLSAIFAKLKGVKNIQLIAGCAAVILVLTVYFAFASCGGDTAATGADDADLSDADYCTAMQVRIENTVSQIAGVGSCSVVINWDKPASPSHGFSSAPSENPKPLGALIVCDGGGSTKVKLDVMFAVSTLLDLSIEKITVYPKNTL